MFQKGRWILLFVFLLGLDILSKYLVYSNIPLMNPFQSYPFGGIGIFNVYGITFSINHVENLGAAWGMFSSYSMILLIFRMLVILGLFGYLIATKMELWKRLSLFFILTGAIGNVIDFFAYGHVIDFIYFTFWGYSYPLFNIADSLIFIGILLFLLTSFKRRKNDGN